MDVYQQSLALHKKLGGKIRMVPSTVVETKEELSLVYTPGVARVCEVIAQDPGLAKEYTIKKNMVAVITDGSAVLGLGNIGPEASLPVMEGKAMLFKLYADVDAVPICIKTQDTKEIIHIIRNIAPTFAGVNLEDISAPRCFEIEQSLQDLGIPVFHDDQHGTSITFLGALINASKLSKKPLSDLKIVINGAGAAGTAIAELLLDFGKNPDKKESVKQVLLCDSKGIISPNRPDLESNPAKLQLAQKTNPNNITGSLSDAMKNADVFVGVSIANVVTADMVKLMAEKPMIFAMANPIPEIMPDVAKAAGAFIVGTGRSDFPNQINNVLIFPGIFRGALDANASRITHRMKIAAAYALAETVENPTVDAIIPSALDKKVAMHVAKAVSLAAH